MIRLFFVAVLNKGLPLLFLVVMLAGCQSTNSQTTISPSMTQEMPLNQTELAQKKVNSASEKVEQTVDWNQPSGGKYPLLQKGEAIWIDVSIGKQQVYIKDGDQTLYTMVTSSGLDTSPDTSTPHGTFEIEQERGPWFYNKSEQEGAKYFVSWKNHGEFLFHSVAMDKNGKVIEEEARKLGQKASHGCFRLTLPDAKWIYDHIPVKTKVVVHD